MFVKALLLRRVGIIAYSCRDPGSFVRESPHVRVGSTADRAGNDAKLDHQALLACVGIAPCSITQQGCL